MRTLVVMEKESAEDTIERVFRRFEQVDDQQTKWTSLDTNMSFLAWLDDDQIVRESEAVHKEHQAGKPRCKMEHPDERCFAPTIVKAVGHIIDGHKASGKLSKENRYVLEYYISLAKIGEVFVSAT